MIKITMKTFSYTIEQVVIKEDVQKTVEKLKAYDRAARISFEVVR